MTTLKKKLKNNKKKNDKSNKSIALEMRYLTAGKGVSAVDLALQMRDLPLVRVISTVGKGY